jgi:hypothetical protein
MINLSLYENEFQRASKFSLHIAYNKILRMFVITKDSNSKISKAKRFYKNKKNQNRFGEKFKRKQIMVFF